MDFTRQPIIETIITPREGFRLVVRSSKNMGQEELFVDALEVVSFGATTLFFRSMEKPRPFLVPASDYEVVEVREQRLMLKTPVASHQENSYQPQRAQKQERPNNERQQNERFQNERPQAATQEEGSEEKKEPQGMRQERNFDRNDRRRDRNRRRRGNDRTDRNQNRDQPALTDEVKEPQQPMDPASASILAEEPPPLFRTILPPPQTLIRDDLQRLRDNELYRGAFYIREEKQGNEQDDDDVSLRSIEVESALQKEAPEHGESFRLSETDRPEIHSNPPISLP